MVWNLQSEQGSLLGKWSWRFAEVNNTLLKDIIRLNMGPKKGIGSLRLLEGVMGWAYERRLVKGPLN